jgi:hypothetical protein
MLETCTFSNAQILSAFVPVQVRSLASASAHDGTVDAATVKFVRHQKTTMIELQRRAAERAQQIFDKQASVGVCVWGGRGACGKWKLQADRFVVHTVCRLRC